MESLFNQLWDFFRSRPLDAAFVVGTLLVAMTLADLAIRYCAHHYRRHWYSLDPPACSADLLRIATEDPLRHRRRRYRSWKVVVKVIRKVVRFFRDAIVFLLVFTGLAALVVYFATTPGVAVADGAALVLALTAAVLSLFAFFYQTRARVLHLNPSELDHRVLLALLRRALDRERSVDGLALDELDAPPAGDLTNLHLWITRLSTAILKREWEQVKHVR